MGFDYECIVDIQSLSGEYFCPVCRQLVYPDEALRSQCSHLYCKPCLTYIVSTTQACPYDGFLVTEADTKLLSEADKTLAETIGKIPVHCLYHRSGCQWQGPLSECSSHCSGCAFGNSPVVCNRCGIQIVHRQVQEHVQNCPGVQSQVQQMEGVHAAAAAAAAAMSTSANQIQTTNVSSASTTQSLAPQPAAAPPSQDANQQVTASSQVQAATSTAVPTPGQWYQQQYQQYYQQYPGYDPYQQQYQYYYPYQQPIQQYQQHPSNVQGQPQTQVYAQPQQQAQIQLQPQAQAQPQMQTQTQSLIQPQPLQHAQAPLAVQNQNQAAVNAQHHLYPAGQTPVQMQLQVQAPPHGHHHPQPLTQSHAQVQLPQPQPVQLRPQQPMQVPQYQQPHSQIQHPPAQIQQQAQSHAQPHQPLPQQPQTHPQTQLQQLHSHPQTQPPFQVSQPQNPNPPPQSHHPPVHAVTDHQSYPQPQVHQHVQLPQHMNPQNGPLPQHPPHQVHGQFPQQPPQMRPMQSNAPLPNQQPPALLPAQGPAPSFPLAQQHPVYPHAQQPGYPGHQRPVMQPTQQTQSVQSQQTFQGQTPGLIPNQLHPSGPFLQQQQPSMLSQSHPQGPSHSLPQGVHHLPSQQSITSQNMPLQQSQNYNARPIVPSRGPQSQPLPQSPTIFAGAAQVKPMQPAVNQASVGQSDTLQRDNRLQMSSEQQIAQPVMSSEPAILLRQGDKKLSEQQNGSPLQSIAKKESGDLIPTSGPGVDSAVVKASKSESHVVSTDGGLKPKEDIETDANTNARRIDSEHAIKHGLKKEGDESIIGPSVGGVTMEALAEGKTDAANFHQQEKYSSVGGALSAGSLEERNGKPVDSEVARKGIEKGAQAGVQNQSHLGPKGPGVEEIRGFHMHSDAQGKAFTNLAEQVPLTDQGRHPNMPLHFAPSIQHQRHAGGSLYPPAHPPGAPHPLQSQNIPRPQGPGQLPQPGQNVVPPEHFLAGPPERSFDASVAPQGDYRHHHLPPLQAGLPRILQNEPPASFDASVKAMGRALPPGPGGQIGQPNPVNPMETELFHNQRSSHLDGRQPGLHPFGTSDRGPFGEPVNVESNVMRMNRAQGSDPALAVGLRDERFKSTTEDGLNRFPVEPARHHDRVFKPPYNRDASNDVRDRARPLGLDGNTGRMDSVRSYPDFRGTAPDFGRHHMDKMALRSPGREYPDFPSRDFGGVSRFPRNQPGLDDINGWESRPFSDVSRGMNFHTDLVGNSFSQSRFPMLPAHLQRDELDGPGNLRGGDMSRPDIFPPHLRKGDVLGPRNFPSHLPLAEPGFGGFGHPLTGDLAGPGNISHLPPVGEPFGGNRFGHPRIGEPGFRSSYSLAGGMDPFDRRRPPGMVLCRICKIDCETVEGLELHSQTREHQKMAMSMVLNIKQNAKKRKTSTNLSALEEPSKLRGSGYEVRGNKH